MHCSNKRITFLIVLCNCAFVYFGSYTVLKRAAFKTHERKRVRPIPILKRGRPLLADIHYEYEEPDEKAMEEVLERRKTNTVIKTTRLPGRASQASDQDLLGNDVFQDFQHHRDNLSRYLSAFIPAEAAWEKHARRVSPDKEEWTRIPIDPANPLYKMLTVESNGTIVEDDAYKGRDLQQLVRQLKLNGQHLNTQNGPIL